MASYSELVTATVELNLSDFEAKMKAADAAVKSFAAGTKKTGNAGSFSFTGKEMIDAAKAAMVKFTEDVMTDSLVEVPKDTNTLADSSASFAPVKVGNRIRVEMGYGYGDEINPKTKRRASQYALPVHEIYDAEHEPPTKSHYLIDPLLERARFFGADLGVAMRAAATGSYSKYKVSGSAVELDTGFSQEDKRARSIGGGFSKRGGNPLNRGQFSK